MGWLSIEGKSGGFKLSRGEYMVRSLNPDHVTAVIRWANQGPYFRLLGMEIVELGMGFSVVKSLMEEKHRHPFGSVHGGAYASLIDTACFWAAYCELDEGLGLTTLDLQTNNLASIKEGVIIARKLYQDGTDFLPDGKHSHRPGRQDISPRDFQAVGWRMAIDGKFFGRCASTA